jgi:hypothetical protein
MKALTKLLLYLSLYALWIIGSVIYILATDHDPLWILFACLAPPTLVFTSLLALKQRDILEGDD